MSGLIAREKLVAMYAAYPGALESEVAQALAELGTEEQRIGHNEALRRIVRLIATGEGQRLMWHNVARAIIDTAMDERTGVTRNGKEV